MGGCMSAVNEHNYSHSEIHLWMNFHKVGLSIDIGY
jgi:hypothetical protein